MTQLLTGLMLRTIEIPTSKHELKGMHLASLRMSHCHSIAKKGLFSLLLSSAIYFRLDRSLFSMGTQCFLFLWTRVLRCADPTADRRIRHPAVKARCFCRSHRQQRPGTSASLPHDDQQQNMAFVDDVYCGSATTHSPVAPVPSIPVVQC
jgi:hypothetical protein